MEYFLLHELILIGCRERIDPVQPEKSSIYIFWKRKKACCTPLFLFGRVEGPDSCLGGSKGPTERENTGYFFMNMATTEDG